MGNGIGHLSGAKNRVRVLGGSWLTYTYSDRSLEQDLAEVGSAKWAGVGLLRIEWTWQRGYRGLLP